MNYSKGRGQGTASCRSLTGLLQSPHFLCSYVHTWFPHKIKPVLKLKRIQRIATKMVAELEDLTYEERLKEMHLTTLKEKRERGNLITIYKLMNNLEET